MSTVYVQAGRLAGDNQVTVGPRPGVLSSSNSHDASGISPLYGPWQEAADSNAGTQLAGPGGAVGLVAADAQVSVTNLPAQAVATASAVLSYYFEISANDTLAHADVLQVPVSFSATGHGEISEGFGRIFGSAVLSAPAFPFSSYNFSYEGAANSRSFSHSVTLPLAVGGSARHLVTLTATATAYNFAAIDQTASSQASVAVDPVIRFDQAAFDAARGDATFDLAQAYSLSFSAVPVPEPAAAWLLLAGLAVLPFMRRTSAVCGASVATTGRPGAGWSSSSWICCKRRWILILTGFERRVSRATACLPGSSSKTRCGARPTRQGPSSPSFPQPASIRCPLVSSPAADRDPDAVGVDDASLIDGFDVLMDLQEQAMASALPLATSLVEALASAERGVKEWIRAHRRVANPEIARDAETLLHMLREARLARQKGAGVAFAQGPHDVFSTLVEHVRSELRPRP